jgi:hypothetical protein
MGGRNDEKGFVRLGGSAVAEDTAKTLIWPASLVLKGKKVRECSHVY